MKTNRLIIAASIAAVAATTLYVRSTLLSSLPSLPSIKTVTTVERTEPVLRKSIPNSDLSLAVSTIEVSGESKRRTGPCEDRRRAYGTVRLHVVLPRSAMDDGDTIVVHADRLRTYAESDLTIDADDGTCSRLAHMFARPTSSPDLDRQALRAAVANAGHCLRHALLRVGGTKVAAERSLAAWGIYRPVQVTGDTPLTTCLSAETELPTDLVAEPTISYESGAGNLAPRHESKYV